MYFVSQVFCTTSGASLQAKVNKTLEKILILKFVTLKTLIVTRKETYQL